MTRTTRYPSPALIVLVACGIVISCASQQQANFDPMWLGICSLLFLAGCLVSFNIIRTLPAAPMRIAMTREIWQRAQYGLIIGVLCVAVAFSWLLWSLDSVQAGGWASIAVVMGPTLVLGLVGLVLIYYWLGLWAFGAIESETKKEE